MNGREHTDEHIDLFAASIVNIGSTLPIVTGGENTTIAGQGRVAAAQRLGVDVVSTISLAFLTEKERKHYIITLVQFGKQSGWPPAMLQIDLQHLKKMRPSNMAKINGGFFHANGTEALIGSRPNLGK